MSECEVCVSVYMGVYVYVWVCMCMYGACDCIECSSVADHSRSFSINYFFLCSSSQYYIV